MSTSSCYKSGVIFSSIASNYSAPEMLKSEKYDHAVDWYALGAVLCASLLSKVNFCIFTFSLISINYISPSDPQFPYPVPVEQKEKQELLKQVSEEAGDILQKVFKLNYSNTARQTVILNLQ